MAQSEYRCFVTLADTLSFSRAAHRLGLHASSVSRIIDRLETRLGLPVIERAADGVRLTAFGDSLCRLVTPLLDRLDTGVTALCDNERLGGTLRIMAPPEVLTESINPVICTMLAEYPDMTVRLEGSVALPDFQRQDLDVFISHRRDEMTPGAYKISRVGSYAVGLFAAPSLLARLGEPCTPEVLPGWPVLVRPGEDMWTFRSGPGEGKSWSIPLRARISATPAPVRLDLACAGYGLVAASLGLCHDLVARGDLVPVLSAYPLPDGALYAAQPLRHEPRPVVVSFLARLTARLRARHAVSVLSSGTAPDGRPYALVRDRAIP